MKGKKGLKMKKLAGGLASELDNGFTNGLKADLHIHSAEDPEDKILHTARELIDHAASLDYDILAITLHNGFLPDKSVFSYAKKRGILLIPGYEAEIEGCHVLLYNVKKLLNVKKLSDLRELKRKHDLLIIAPHPYVPLAQSLHERLEKHIDVFDAIEVCWFHSWLVNPNKKAFKVARKYKLPLVANSDAHSLSGFGKNYTFIESSKSIPSVLSAIREGRVRLHSPPRSLFSLSIAVVKILYHDLFMKPYR